MDTESWSWKRKGGGAGLPRDVLEGGEAISGFGSGFDRSTYERARRKRAERRLTQALRNEDTQELLPLDEVTRRLRQFAQRYAGIRTIPIERIVGTVDRNRDFDREFLPRTPDIRDRWKRVEAAFPDGNFPPIVVYEVDGSYFLVDGHHRVAIAKQRGVAFIDAEVTQLRTRYPLPTDADIGRIIHTEQERAFMEESGLDRARPEVRIELTRPHGYLELLEDIRVHGYFLMKEHGGPVPDPAIAADWYDWLYVPMVGAAHQAGLHELFPDAPDGDLFLWLQHKRRALYPERGPITNEEVARLALEEEQHVGNRAVRRAARKRVRREYGAERSQPAEDTSKP